MFFIIWVFKSIDSLSIISQFLKSGRQLLLDKYGCCEDKLEACHIIEVKNNGNYDINNGLLLWFSKNINKLLYTFQKTYFLLLITL